MKRKIIKIDQEKCNGCGMCMPNCPEGAIRIIDHKARLVSELFCDGLGACIGHCPQGAITVEEREAQDYDEKKVMANIVKHGENTTRAHLEHLKAHGQDGYLAQALDYLKESGIGDPLKGPQEAAHRHVHGSSCPGARVMDFRKKETAQSGPVSLRQESQLRQWPVQLMLVPSYAPYLNNTDILIAADCVPFAYAGFHDALLKGKTLLVGCPKFDDLQAYRQKLEQILEHNKVNSITYAHMEVPCCSGLTGIIREAIAGSGKRVPFKEAVISVTGERIQ